MSKGGLINFYDLKAIKEIRDESFKQHFDETNIEIPSRICIVGASYMHSHICTTATVWNNNYGREAAAFLKEK